MGKISLLRRIPMYAASAMMVGFGFSGFASAQTITNTGPDSRNTIESTVKNTCKVQNKNNVNVNNRNNQSGYTGDATVGGGVGWAGWQILDPTKAQDRGQNHGDWWNNVNDWMAAHGNGNGWSSKGDGLSWTPSGDNWDSYDPMTWQANGQSFGNWRDGAQNYLSSHSPNWMTMWPQGGGNTTGGDATSGDVTNNNSTDIWTSIDNGDPCAQHKAVVPPAKNKQNAMPPRVEQVAAPETPSTTSSSVGGGAGSATGSVSAGAPSENPSGGAGAAVNAPSVARKPVGSMGAGPAKPAAPPQQATISNTGPESVNAISEKVVNDVSVKNTNNVHVENSNYQTGKTGDATVSGNTTGGNATSGSVYNNNETSVHVEISN